MRYDAHTCSTTLLDLVGVNMPTSLVPVSLLAELDPAFALAHNLVVKNELVHHSLLRAVGQ